MVQLLGTGNKSYAEKSLGGLGDVIWITGEAKTTSQMREELALILASCYHQSCFLTTHNKGVQLWW